MILGLKIHEFPCLWFEELGRDHSDSFITPRQEVDPPKEQTQLSYVELAKQQEQKAEAKHSRLGSRSKQGIQRLIDV